MKMLNSLGPLEHLTCDSPSAWVKNIEFYSLSATCLIIFYPSFRPLIQIVSWRFVLEKAVGNTVEDIAEI